MSNEPTTTEQAPPKGKTIKDLLLGDSFKAAVQQTLPRHLTPDRFLRIAVSALTRTPKLQQCEHHSFFGALMTLSQLGLEPDGRRAHLIPFENRKRNVVECQLIVDYKGLVELVMRSGTISFVHADVVCENDRFTYDRGQVKEHIIDFHRPRGDMYAAYALCRFKDGTEKADCMTKDDIDAIRARSRARDNGPWVSDYNEMAKKTVFRRLSKWLPWSPELADALEQDADALEEKQLASAKQLFELPEPQNFVSPQFAGPRQIENQPNQPDQPEAPPKRGPGRPRKEPPILTATPPETTANANAPGEQPTPPAPESPQVALQEVLAGAGVAFEDFRGWLITTGFAPEDVAATIIDWQSVPDGLAESLLKPENAPKLARCIKLYGKPQTEAAK